MRKFKFLTVMLSFMVFIGTFAACNPDNSSSQSSTPTHTCESVCEECGKCTDADCTEEACTEKCQGHTVTPAHTCESVCPTCQKCTDAACTETACAEKCQGHTPAHTCESVCPTCQKCTDADCTETACTEKCQGHTPAHTCESVCPTCQKCTDAACTETACADKCEGHTPAHTCESVCETCNKCTDLDCTETACAEKCQGHTPAHTCESVCETCNKCTDLDCDDEVCEDKCFGHTVASDDWDTFELNFMSFNINYSSSSGTDAAEVTSWTQRKEHVLNLVNNSGAHVIGLQEIAEWKSDEQNQRLYFENNLAGKYELVYFGGHVNLATVYDKTVFNLLSTEQYWYSDTPDEVSLGWDGTSYRSATVLMLEHRVTGEIVKAINTHGPLSDTGNVKAFEYLAQRSLSEESDTFTFLCGDFNATPGKLGYVPIAEKLQDCRYTAEESSNRDSRTWNGYKDTATGILDYCFVSKLDNVKVLTYQVRDDKWGEGNYLSDHFAVQTTVRIYNNSEKAWSDFY